MRDKSGCLNCHFLCKVTFEFTWSRINPLPGEFRNMDSFCKLVQECFGSRVSFKCFHGSWDTERIDTRIPSEIKNVIFRKDRSKCPLFSAYDGSATLEAVMASNKRKEGVIDRKTTRRMAWIAIIASFIASLLSVMLPILLSRH